MLRTLRSGATDLSLDPISATYQMDKLRLASPQELGFHISVVALTSKNAG